MGKIISSINITPDGFVDAQYTNADADFFEFTHHILAGTQTVAFGRNTFELFQRVWPPRLEKDDTPAWNNSTIVKAIDVEEINHFKRADQKGLLILGSPALVATLTEMQLVDDYYFCIQPLIAGGGSIHLFDQVKLETPQPLKLKSAKALKSGVLIVHYERAG